MSTIHAPLTGMALPAFANKERLKKVTNDKHVPEPERVQRCVRVVLDVRYAKTIRYGYDPRKAQFKQAPKQVLKPAVKFTHADNEIRHKWLLLTFFCLFFFNLPFPGGRSLCTTDGSTALAEERSRDDRVKDLAQ